MIVLSFDSSFHWLNGKKKSLLIVLIPLVWQKAHRHDEIWISRKEFQWGCLHDDAFWSVLHTWRNDNMLTYTHQMRRVKKKKKEGMKNGDRKEEKKYWYELWISIFFDAKRLITWVENAKRTESETEETHFHRDANISTSLQTCLGFNLKIFLVYATHEYTTIKSGRKEYDVGSEKYEICFICLIFLRF